jgi:hypothetical protein
MSNKRKENEPPLATSEWGWRYHHLGIPTDMQFKGEKYLPQFRFFVSGFDTSPFGIEWMRFVDEGTRVAMIIHNGAPVELIEFNKNSKKE